MRRGSLAFDRHRLSMVFACFDEVCRGFSPFFAIASIYVVGPS